MLKELIYVVLLLLLAVSCEEYYHPEMEILNGNLVVEAQITNEASRNTIHLTQTRSFYDKLAPLEVTGASVRLMELGTNNSIVGHETSSGHYLLNSLPESGKTYYLRITTQNETYESSAVTMPPAPELKKFYTEYQFKNIYVNTPYIDPLTFDFMVRELYADLSMTPALAHYRFKIRNLIEWSWDANPSAKSLYPTVYGWYSFTDNEKFMIAGPADFNRASVLERFNLLTLFYNPWQYLSTDTLVSHGHIVMIDLYGTSKESYDFHQQLNGQFSANGSLFDPVQTQIQGNIHCSTTPSEKVYGYFDLNSFRQYRYYFYLNPPPGVYVEREILKYPDIPYNGEIFAPSKTEEDPNPPFLPPDWWEE